MSLTVRPATESDAVQVASLSREFTSYLQTLGDPTDFRFSAETYKRDGFGPKPVFCGLVAETNSEIVGYLLYHFGYDADLAARILHIIDLYVAPEHRMFGAGKALMTEAQMICREENVREMLWSVYKPNKLARGFYDHLGAELIDDLDYMHIKVDP